MIAIRTNVAYTSAYGCWLCLHVGSVAVYLGRRRGSFWKRLEVCTPFHWFRLA